MITLLLVDDNAMIRQALRGILDDYDDITVVGEAADGVTAFHLALSLRPAVVLMDVGLSRLNGIDATRRIKDLLPHTAIIGLSVHDVGHIESAMLAAGASAFLSKDTSPDQLVATIREQIEHRSSQVE
ncbi:MAG TPA: response regulator transcription factor [Nitrospiraceae bacterium]|nr:response regulator transcription factor [Nitrospiraceae bacterium]